MITIASAVKELVKEHSFLDEGLSRQIINYSGLARELKPQVEKRLSKKIKNGAIIMALKRMNKKPLQRPIEKIFKETPDMIVKSKLIAITFSNSDSMHSKRKDLIGELNPQNKHFVTVTSGIFETTIIASCDLEEKILSYFQKERIAAHFTNLSSITIKLPKEAVPTAGVFYFFLKSLAWEGISVVEVVSTLTELTIVLNDNDVNRAFSLLKSIF